MTQGRLLTLMSVLLASSDGLGHGKPGHAQNGRPFLQYPFASMPTQAKVNQKVSLKVDLKVSPVNLLDQRAVPSPAGPSGPSPSEVSHDDLQYPEFDLGTKNVLPAEFRDVNTDHMRLPRLEVPFDEVNLPKVNLHKVNVAKVNFPKVRPPKVNLFKTSPIEFKPPKVNFPKVRPPKVNLFKASPIEFKPPKVNMLKATMSKVKLTKVKGSVSESDLEMWWDEGSEGSEP